MSRRSADKASAGKASADRASAGKAPFLPTLFLPTLFLPTLFPPTGFADEIYFTSGRSMKGLVVEEHADRLVVSTVDGEQVILRREVDEVFFDDPERNFIYLGNEALAAGDLQAAVTLYRKALQLNPRWEEGLDALRRAEDHQRRLTNGWSVADPVQALWNHWGLRLAATDDYPVVAEVVPEGMAQQAGLQAADQVIAVWGESAAFRPLPEVAERLLGPAGTPVKLTIQRLVTVAATRRPALDWPGFEVTMAPAGLTVSKVGPLGASAGLKPDDLIVQLNGRLMRYVPLASARTMLREAKSRGLQVAVHRHHLIIRP